MHNGLSVAAYNLAPVGPDDGGFVSPTTPNPTLPQHWNFLEERYALEAHPPLPCINQACVPGTHKSNYPFPDHLRDMDAVGVHESVRRCGGPPGSCIIFTEVRRTNHPQARTA